MSCRIPWPAETAAQPFRNDNNQNEMDPHPVRKYSPVVAFEHAWDEILCAPIKDVILSCTLVKDAVEAEAQILDFFVAVAVTARRQVHQLGRSRRPAVPAERVYLCPEISFWYFATVLVSSGSKMRTRSSSALTFLLTCPPATLPETYEVGWAPLPPAELPEAVAANEPAAAKGDVPCSGMSRACSLGVKGRMRTATEIELVAMAAG